MATLTNPSIMVIIRDLLISSEWTRPVRQSEVFRFITAKDNRPGFSGPLDCHNSNYSLYSARFLLYVLIELVRVRIGTEFLRLGTSRGRCKGKTLRK